MNSTKTAHSPLSRALRSFCHAETHSQQEKSVFYIIHVQGGIYTNKNITMSIVHVFVWSISIICLKFKYNCPMKYDYRVLCYKHDNLCPLFLMHIMHVTPKCKQYVLSTASTVQLALLFIIIAFHKCNILANIDLHYIYKYWNPLCKPPVL